MKIILTENQNKFIRRYEEIESGVWEFVLSRSLNSFHNFDDLLVELSWDVAQDVVSRMSIPEKDRVIFRNQLILFIKNNFYSELKELWDRNNPLNESKNIPLELRRRINKFEEELNTTLRESDPCEYARFDQYKRGIMNYTLMPFLDDENIHLNSEQNVFEIRDYLIKIFENKIRLHYDAYGEEHCPDDPEIVTESQIELSRRYEKLIELVDNGIDVLSQDEDFCGYTYNDFMEEVCWQVSDKIDRLNLSTEKVDVIEKVHRWVRNYLGLYIREEFDKLIQLNCVNSFDDAYEDD
jgi:hypothetical protein